MSFFDDKQEVLNIELTPYGRYLLSKGNFKPAYYAFFDDDVLYDSRFGFLSESQNDTQTRILSETPINKPQALYGSLLDDINNLNKIIYAEDGSNLERKQMISDKSYAPSLPLGNSDPNSEFYPAWNLNFTKATISSSYEYVDNSTTLATDKSGDSYYLQPYLKIPQVNLNDCFVHVQMIKDANNFDDTYVLVDEVLVPDGSYSVVSAFLKYDYILLDLQELNVLDLNDNFNIELFIEGSDSNGTNWQELQFFKKTVFIENNLLLDSPKEYKSILDSDLINNSLLVDHFVEIMVDDEIDLPPELKSEFNTLYKSDAKGPFGTDCPPGVKC